MIERVRVLLIEDNPGDARLIREMLAGRVTLGVSYEVTWAENLAGQTPVVVLTGADDDELTVQAVRHGAQDYLSKNENHPQLLTRVIHYAIERKRNETLLQHLATHDPLTGLPNRVLLYDRLEKSIHRANRKICGGEDDRYRIAVIVGDLNGFKRINDQYGHEVGDLVLKQVAHRLKAALRQTDTISRIGGDEFVMVVEDLADRTDCEQIAHKLIDALKSPPILAGKVDGIGISLGISIFPEGSPDVPSLLRCADRAMYAAKRGGDLLAFYEAGKKP